MAKYDVKYKKRVLMFYESNGITATIKKFRHDPSVIYRWKRKSETVGFMRKKMKKYTKEEKLGILNYYWKNGTTDTETKYDISPPIFYKWERIFREYGLDALDWDGRGRKPKILGSKKDLNKNSDLLSENQRLRLENLYLKKLDALVQRREEQEQKKKL